MTKHSVCFGCISLKKYKLFPESIIPEEARHLPRELQYCMVSGRLLSTKIKDQIADVGCMSRFPQIKPLCDEDDEE